MKSSIKNSNWALWKKISFMILLVLIVCLAFGLIVYLFTSMKTNGKSKSNLITNKQNSSSTYGLLENGALLKSAIANKKKSQTTKTSTSLSTNLQPKFSYMCILVTVPFKTTPSTKKTTKKNKTKKTSTTTEKAKLTAKTTSTTTKKNDDQNKLLALMQSLLALLSKNNISLQQTRKPTKTTEKRRTKPTVLIKTTKQKIKTTKTTQMNRKKTTKKPIRSTRTTKTTKKGRPMPSGLIKTTKKGTKTAKKTTRMTSPKTSKTTSKKQIKENSPDAQMALISKLLTFFDPKLLKLLGQSASQQTTLAMRKKTIESIKRERNALLNNAVQSPAVNQLNNFSSLISNDKQIECGLVRPKSKFNWLVSIRSGCAIQKQICLAMLISSAHVLTTSSCIQHLKCSKLFISNQEYEMRRLILPSIFGQDEFTHSGISGGGRGGTYNSIRPDLAIIKLDRQVGHQTSMPICLHDDSKFKFKINSFKFVRFDEQTKEEHVDLEDVSCLDGQFRYSNMNQLFCLKHEVIRNSNKKLLCSNDHGGGLMYRLDGKWHLYAILSNRFNNQPTNWSNPSCLNSQIMYSVFTKIDRNNLDWIQKSISNN